MSSPSRIFLSSTAIDMEEHRKKASDALQRLDNLPVRMEVFGARPNTPVAECKKEVINSYALIVMVAHRYGWVPSVAEGGDGEKSITWIEVETALANKIPVLAFVVDNNYAWTKPREQDQLTTTKDPVKIAEIVQNVQSLQKFKEFLESGAGLVREKFTTPDDLGMKVATSVASLLKEPAETVNRVSIALPYKFDIVHHLQPAPHFRGRKALLQELINWWHTPVTPDRVRSLVAIGGTGKTALAERFLESIKHETLRGSVLVWSFYDAPDTDAFLREACILFSGEEPKGEGGKLEQLQRALAAGSGQNLIVIDGLERVQSEGKGTSMQAKGHIEDYRLKNLLMNMAAGQLGNTRALITTRFKLIELAQRDNAGYKSHELDVLDTETAVEVLRAWEIKGTDEQLAAMGANAGNHALSVSVLGSYLHNFCNGDPDGANEFKLDEVIDVDEQAAKLQRILSGYAKNLPDKERDLLVRLSVFPKGITVDILGYVIEAGGQVAGALVGESQHALALIAEKLRQQGLIYSYKAGNTIYYTSHPFLREYFRTLLNVKSEDIHEAVREKLAIGLDTKPENKPTDSEVLNKYEELIQYSILSGHYDEAYDLFRDVLGGGGGGIHIYHILGDYGRMIRVLSLFSDDGTLSKVTTHLDAYQRGKIYNYWGLAEMALGNLYTTEICLSLGVKASEEVNDIRNVLFDQVNIASLNLNRGLFSAAQKGTHSALDILGLQEEDYNIKLFKKSAFAYLAHTLHCQGEVLQAKKYFSDATMLNGKALFSDIGVYEAEHLIATGATDNAIKSLEKNIATWGGNPMHRDVNLCRYWLGILSLPHAILEAREHLHAIRAYTEKSGFMESIIQAYILAAEIAYCSQDYPAALAEATAGLNQADSCGYGKHAIDLLLLLSKIYIAVPEYTTALSYARQAMDRSLAPECGYAWGQANGAHFCGICHKALGEYELARQRLEFALELREKIQHPEAEVTRKLLSELPTKK